MALITDRLLFIHVPKTGGSTVRAILAANGARETGQFAVEDHYGLPEIRAAHPEAENGRLSFGAVRAPWEWIRSRWAWGVLSGFQEKIAVEPAAARHWMADCWSLKFDRFVDAYLERHPGACGRTFFSMLGFWTERPVQAVIRQESLTADLSAVCENAGQPIAIDEGIRRRVGASGDMKDQCVLSRERTRLIADAEHMVCERFGYDV